MADEQAVTQPQATTGESASSGSIDDFVKSRNHLEFSTEYKPSHTPAEKTESAPVTEDKKEAPADELPAQAASPESAPDGNQQTEAPRIPDEDGSEPEGSEKAVKELIAQRKQRREAQELAAARERENAYLRGLLEGKGITLPADGRPVQQAPQQGPPPKPTIEEFETYEQFEAARDQWMDDMVDFRASQIANKVVQKTTEDTVQQTFIKRLAEVEKTTPTIKEAFDEVGRQINVPMAQYIKLSSEGPKVLLYLHSHADETARIAKLNPYAAMAELGIIEGKITAVAEATKPAPAQQQNKQSKAPPPTRPVVNNGTSVNTALDKLDIDEFMKERNKAQFGR